MRRFLAASIFVLAAGLGNASAQSLPSTPDPNQCVVEPRPTEFFEPLVEQIVVRGSAATPEALEPTSTLRPMPEGVAASKATATEVVELLSQAVACTNAQDFPRLAALFTDEGARDAVLVGWGAGFEAVQGSGDESATPMSARSLLDAILRVGPPVAENQRAGLIRVMDVRELPDGQFTAVAVRSLSGGGEVTALEVFERVDQELRIANELPIQVELGTPAP